MVCPDFNKIAENIQDAHPTKFRIWYSLLVLLPTFSLTLVSYIILGENWDATCGTSWIPLQIWLLFYAILQTIYFVESIIAGFRRTTISGSKIIVYGTIVKHSLLFIWNIVGAVALFRDSGACETLAHSLFTMVLSVLCVQWILMILLCIMGCFLLSMPCIIACSFMCCGECCCPNMK